jgi:hypothetical protein
MKTLFTMAAVAGGLMMVSGAAQAQSQWQCQQFAQQQAQAYAPQGAGLVGGGLLGALGGAAIGAATGGNAGTGAIIGGVGGAVVGGAANQAKYNQIYQQAYWNCMNGGARPAPAPKPVPVVGPAPTGQATVYQALNVRSTPGGSVIFVLQPHTSVAVAGCQPSWCQVSTPAGWGWASRKYLYFQ